MGNVVSVAMIEAYLCRPQRRADEQHFDRRVAFEKRGRKATVENREAEQYAQKRGNTFDERFPGIVEIVELLAFHVVEPGDAALVMRAAGLSAEYNKSSAGDQVPLAVILSSVEGGEDE